jgi:hypothetical protein
MIPENFRLFSFPANGSNSSRSRSDEGGSAWSMFVVVVVADVKPYKDVEAGKKRSAFWLPRLLTINKFD